MNRFKQTFLLVLCLALTLSFVSCANHTSEGITVGYLLQDGMESRPEWVLKIGEKSVSFDKYRHFFLNEKLELDFGKEGYFEEHPEAEKTLKETVLNDLKEAYALEAIAKEHSVELTDDELREAEAKIAQDKSELSEEIYINWLNNLFLTEELYSELLKSNALYDKTYKTLLEDGGLLHISDDELKDHLEENYFCYAQIYVDFASGEGTNIHTTTDKTVAEIQKRLSDGDDFYAVAFSHSDDQTMMDYKNGYLKEKSSLDEDVREILGTLKDNEISEPLLKSDGYYIFKKMPIGE
ncbi:MAG: SurA N-terminal domain-containing protein, partial [Clostridia bacterium]|nr:SurA N-terminal domain-containing protein [Clostridia bacterium]